MRKTSLGMGIEFFTLLLTDPTRVERLFDTNPLMRERERWLAVKCRSYNIGLGLGLVLLLNYDLTFIGN
jgi:hypothetical protein